MSAVSSPAHAKKAARDRRMKLLPGAIALAAVVLVVAIVLGSHHNETKPGTAHQTAGLFAGIPQQGITLGDPGAKTTLTEFADLQCPFCREFAIGQLPAVVRDHVRTGQVKVVFRNLAFLGPDSVKAAKFAAAAGEQNKLFDFIDRFYANQQEENTGYVTDAFLRKVAGQVPGLDAQKAFAAANSPAVARQLNEANAAAKAAGVNSTPTFLLNGRTYDASNVTQALERAAT